MRATAILQRRAPSAIRRLPLTTKQGPHNYYKGNRTGSMGQHTKWGGYTIDYAKVRTYVCPDLRRFYLTPFVSHRVKSEKDDFYESPSEEFKGIEHDKDDFSHEKETAETDGAAWLQRWKEAEQKRLMQEERTRFAEEEQKRLVEQRRGKSTRSLSLS